MNDKSIKIDDVIIDPAYIIAIDLRAMILPSDDCKYQPGVNITLAAIAGDMQNQTNLIPPRITYQLEYVGPQAETLRPWLAEMFPCEGRSVRLPEVDVKSGEGDGDDDGLKIIKCTGCGIEVFEDEIGGGWRGDLWFCVICRGDNDAPEKCQECHEPIEVAANERFCSHKCGMAWQKFLAELPF